MPCPTKSVRMASITYRSFKAQIAISGAPTTMLTAEKTPRKSQTRFIAKQFCISVSFQGIICFFSFLCALHKLFNRNGIFYKSRTRPFAKKSKRDRILRGNFRSLTRRRRSCRQLKLRRAWSKTGIYTKIIKRSKNSVIF